jgi:isoquinoline 1-oxidoreductase subunit beta
MMSEQFAIESRVLSRRTFLAGTGATCIGFAFGVRPQYAFAAMGELMLNAWVSIGTDGVVTIMSVPAEMGQGTMTALPAALAEDLDADWTKVKVVQAPANPKLYGNPKIFGQMRTLGSRAVPGYYEPVRLAGAQARKVLIANAAVMLGVPGRGGACEIRAQARLWRDRQVGQGARSSTRGERRRPQAAGAMPAHRQKPAPRRYSRESERQGDLRHRRATPGHALRRGAVLAGGRRKARKDRRFGG